MTIDNDQIARQSKLFVDGGQDTEDEAAGRLRSLCLTVSVGEAAAASPAGQAAFLTAVNIAVRCFAGGVRVTGALDSTVITPLGSGQATLGGEAARLGARVLDGDYPELEVVIGNAAPSAKTSIHAWWQGWVAGRGPEPRIVDAGHTAIENPLAAMAAASLCVGAAFRSATGHPAAAYMTEQISLWSPEKDDDFGPATARLPNALWLFGLGNLGQAFTWCLSTLPYDKSDHLTLYLQDYDRVSKENWGTSVLVHEKVYGELKTAVAERFLLARGFKVFRVDRALDETFKRQDNEPFVALSGFDKVGPRRWLGEAGFSHIVDVGLGATHTDYSRARVYCFDEGFTPQVHFARTERDLPNYDEKSKLRGYQDIAKRAGRCGLEEYAGHSIAFTFVSCFAACVAVAQLARMAAGEATYSRTIIDTYDVRSRKPLIGNKPDRVQIGSLRVW